MKMELTEENFCKIIDRIEEYWRTAEELEDKPGCYTYDDGTDIPLRNSHELWKAIENERNQKV